MPPEINRAMQKWELPPTGYIKVNWDAKLDSKSKKMGIGIIGRDHTGQVLATYCDTKSYVQDSAATEAWAAWKAVELSIKMGWMKIHLEGDALEVVQAFRREVTWWGSYGATVEEATRLEDGACSSTSQ